MAAFSLLARQRIPVSPETAWSFFSDPANLGRITPRDLDFTILGESRPAAMYPGQLIEYSIRPLWNIPFYWMTEITQVREPWYFVDEQRRGPYSLWHHQHHFLPVEGGVEMTDWIHYRVSMGALGRWVNRLFLERRLRYIFKYRYEQVEILLGKWPGQSFDIEMR